MKLTLQAMRWLRSKVARYTRPVSWRHRISIVVLTVLTASPASGTFCAMLCDAAAATTAAHHGSRRNCEEQDTPLSGLQTPGASGHDCSNHDARAGHVATTMATRSDIVTAPSLLAAVPVHSAPGNLPDSNAAFDYRPPPGSTPLTVSPLVPRI